MCTCNNIITIRIDKILKIKRYCEDKSNELIDNFLENININPEIVFTYFVYDKKKNRCDISTYFCSGISKDYKTIKNSSRHEYKYKTFDAIAYFDGEKKNVIPVGDSFVYDDSVINEIYQELKITDESVAS